MISFDLATEGADLLDGDSKFGPLDPGNYPAIITGVDWRANKKGNGFYLMINSEVVDGHERAGKYLPAIFLNLEHVNEVAVTMAKKDLARLCKAIGIEGFKQMEELIDCKFVARVSVDGEYNTIDGFLPMSDAPKPAPAAPAPAANGQNPSPSYRGSNSAPWLNQ